MDYVYIYTIVDPTHTTRTFFPSFSKRFLFQIFNSNSDGNKYFIQSIFFLNHSVQYPSHYVAQIHMEVK